jgi:asparagine synthase (glutamine-hydrolysing)
MEQGLEIASARLSESPKVPQLEFAPAELPPHNHPQFYTAVEALRALLQDAVRLRLRSDVPVGTCLSGGMDSSSIVSIASALSSQPIRTFSADYQEADCSEGPFISAVVEGCKTVATRITPDPLELIEAFPKIAWAQDEPTGSATLYTQWKVMQSAHGQVTVLLDGQGGDEIFAGYLPYLEDYVREYCDDPEEVRACQELSGQDYSKVASKARFQKRLPAFLRKSEKLKPDPYGVPKIVHPDLQKVMQGCDRSRTPRDGGWSSRLSRRLAHDLTHLSIPQLLRFEDRNSMAFSLEARTPF